MKTKRLFALVIAVLMALPLVLTACGQPTATGLELGDMPAKTVYKAGETFDKTGMIVYVIYDDGSRVATTDYTVDKTTLSAGDTYVTVTAAGFSLQVPVTVTADEQAVSTTNHVIKDKQGNYGGTLNKSKYGEGAPLNGEHDVENSPYYTKNDYFTMQSTETRTLISGFETYQKTMKDSSGIACLLSIMHRDGYDIFSDDLNEVAMVEKYEELNNLPVYGNGTTPQGLKNLFVEMGYSAQANTFSTDTTKAFNTQIKAAEAWFASQFEAGKIVLVRFQDAEDFGWHVVLGVDIVDADWARDGVIIFGDPNDGSDHCQDGYYTMGFGRFCRWWLEVGYNKDEAKMMGANQFDCVVVAPEKAYEIVRGPETMAPQTAYEKHLLLNADGSYAGNTDTSKYGTGTPLNGVGIDRPDLNYHKIVDVYNLVPNDHLHILPQFRAYEQTMASSCALVSLMVVLNYYGYDIVNKYSEVALYDGYNDYFNIDITGKGSSASGRDTFMKSLGFDMKTNVRDVDTKTKFTFPTYNSFAAWVKENVAAGCPMPISWTPIGGHGVTLIGMDDMGTEYTYDDVVFIADSGDTWDNYMDGYNVISAQMFYRQWHGNPAPGKATNAQQYNLIMPPKAN